MQKNKQIGFSYFLLQIWFRKTVIRAHYADMHLIITVWTGEKEQTQTNDGENDALSCCHHRNLTSVSDEASQELIPVLYLR